MKIKLLRLKEIIKISAVTIMLFFMVASPKICMNGALSGLKTAATCVIPSLFPFMVVSKYIVKTGTITKLLSKLNFSKLPSSIISAFVLGSISGYPSGSIIIKDMVAKGELTSQEADSILPFCNNCSPLFVIGTIGLSFLGNVKYGYILYIIHIFSALLYAYITCKDIPCSKTKKMILHNENAPFVKSMQESVVSTLNITAYIVFFSVVSHLASSIPFIKSDIFISLILSLIELSSGCIMLCVTTLSPVLKLCLISFIVGFSGICIIIQTLDVMSDMKINIRKYITAKLCIGLISACITFIVFSFFSPYINTFNDCSAEITTNLPLVFWISFISSMIILFFAAKK